MTWEAVPGAAGYRVQLLDLPADELVGEAAVTAATSATMLLGGLPEERAGIAVQALSSLEAGGAPVGSSAFGFVSAGPAGFIES